ncbi:MAG: aldehyde dehydrogenase family protein [Salibacteraceae bacterium]
MARLKVLKTYKLYIGGKFPRTESGRYFQPLDKAGKPMANMCHASRKDYRNSVVTARKAFDSWSGKTAYNRSQILYRIAEMLEGNRAGFESELIQQGSTKANANKEIDTSIDRLIYYAGWCDKFTQLFGSVNPVASSHFNFSTLEPTGVVTVFIDNSTSLLGLVSAVSAVIASGNSMVAIVPKALSLCSISFAEVLNNSDVPGGVVNILTTDHSEIMPHAGVHMDVNAIWYLGGDKELWKQLQIDSASNLKRVTNVNSDTDLGSESWESPYLLKEFTEVKTTWHPIEQVGGATSSY